jgi:hypothetical protein
MGCMGSRAVVVCVEAGGLLTQFDCLLFYLGGIYIGDCILTATILLMLGLFGSGGKIWIRW